MHSLDLLDRRAELAGQIKALGRRYSNTGIPPAERAQWAALTDEYDSIDDEISQGAQRMNQFIGRDGGTISAGPHHKERFGGTSNTLDRAVAGWCKNQLGQPITSSDAQACSDYGIAANSNVFVVRFAPSMPGNFSNSLSSQDGTAGGFTVPGEFVAQLEQAMLYHSGILQACDTIRTTTAAPMPWPTTNDSGNEGAQIGENAESTELDPTFGAVVFNAYKITSKLVRVPHELLRDSGINLAKELGNMLGTRIGRTLNSKCTTGSGAATAMGIVTASTLGKTTASTTAISFDELIDLMHSVDVAYRTAADGFGWMMHDSVAANVRKLKNGDGDYLWQQSTQLGQPDRLLGWPVTINNHMASSIATTAKTVLCGAFRKYKVRLVAELRLRRLVERFAEFDQEGFLAFQEFDGALLDAGTHPVKYLQQALVSGAGAACFSLFAFGVTDHRLGFSHGFTSMITITVSGIKELNRKIVLFEKSFKASLRKSTRAAAKITAEAARRMVPRDQGLLASTITVRALPRSQQKPHIVGARVLTDPKKLATIHRENPGQIFNPTWSEFGVPLHQHFGQGIAPLPPQPWMRPAMHSTALAVYGSLEKGATGPARPATGGLAILSH